MTILGEDLCPLSSTLCSRGSVLYLNIRILPQCDRDRGAGEQL